MPTSTTSVDSTAYTLLTATNALVQNTSSYPVRIVFDTVLPTAGHTNYHTLLPSQAIVKSDGVPGGNIYARCENDGVSSDVSVSE